jgi:demethylmenaquinone methyltransferase / 2-methoxy-6-polyprenyl-1,4-benzoquinol methylase
MIDDEVFARISKRYDLVRSLISFGRDDRCKRKAVASLAPGHRMLDLGTGTGGMLSAVPRGAFAFRVGVDRETRMVLESRSRNGAAAYVIADVTRLPFRPATFDTVTAAYLLRYVDHHSVAEQVAGVLKTSGAVIFYDLEPPAARLPMLLCRFYLIAMTTLYGLLFHGSPTAYWHLWQTFGGVASADVVRALHETGWREVTLGRGIGGIVWWVAAQLDAHP